MASKHRPACIPCTRARKYMPARVRETLEALEQRLAKKAAKRERRAMAEDTQ